MKILVAILLLLLSAANISHKAKFELIWFDEFDKLESHWFLDEKPRHQAISSQRAFEVSGGELKIKPFVENGKFYSALLTTENSQYFSYGYYEARVKLNTKSGAWSDWWLYDKNMAIPSKEIGAAEIDIFEHRARDETKSIPHILAHVIHWNGYGENHQSDGKDSYLEDEYNVVGLLWTEKEYVFYLNHKEQWRFAKGLTANKVFMIFSVEIQDKWWAGSIDTSEYDGSSMITVDYVRYWKIVD